MGLDAALRDQLVPDGPGEDKVRGAVAVQVADLPPAERECKLPASARASDNIGPGDHRLGDPLARAWWVRHLGVLWGSDPVLARGYKLK